MPWQARHGIDIHSIGFCGPAAAYGHVRPDDLPVPESNPLAAFTVFGRDKVREESLGRLYRYSFRIPVVTARIFHPIGTGMSGRHFLPAFPCRQLQQWKAGRRVRLEVTRLDATRDYVSATDVARALSALAHGQPREAAYNIGSGQEAACRPHIAGGARGAKNAASESPAFRVVLRGGLGNLGEVPWLNEKDGYGGLLLEVAVRACE